MSDRLALANAIEDAGVERAKAERIATVILMRFHGGFATKGGMTRMSDLYDDDILLWSERQADALRRRAANEIDWPNVAEEIEDVGRSILYAVESHLTLALLHDLKAEAWPRSLSEPSWRAEARLHRRLARKKFTPGMRQKINLADLYADALAGLPEELDATAPLPVPPICPVTLEEMLAEAE
jgi:hypothetical protein